jgi:hypothetical protein
MSASLSNDMTRITPKKSLRLPIVRLEGPSKAVKIDPVTVNYG